LGGFGWLGREIYVIEAYEVWRQEIVIRVGISYFRRKKDHHIISYAGLGAIEASRG
jgi:hypothetical protein